MRKISIRFKITAITVAAILTAILTIFIASYPPIRSETERGSVETMRLIGEDTKDKLDEYFAGIQQSVSLVANMAMDSLDSVTLVEYGAAGSYATQNKRTREQTENLDRYIANHCETVKKSLGSAAIRTNGVEAYYYCISPQISGSEHGFFSSRAGKAGFVDQEPLNVALLDEEDTEHNTWYFTPIAKGTPCWVGPYHWHFPKEIEICSYVTPIYSTGVLIGVLGMDIPMETLVEQVRPIRIYQTGYASLYDEDGHILYHPDALKGTAPELSDLSVSEELLAQKDSGDEMIRYDVDGQTRQMCFFTLNNGMKLFLSVPVEEITASWHRILRNILIITILIIILFSVIIMLVMRAMTLPLERLTNASQQLARSNYDVALDYRGRDEIGILTSSFVTMRNQMQGYIEKLNIRAYTDTLTGLPNMRAFFSLAKKEYRRLEENGDRPVMLFFDLVGMKHFNRQYGFEEGDRLLCEVGQILADVYGKQCLCRFSEDHFAVISDEVSLEKRLKEVFERCETANGGNTLPMHVGVYPSKLGKMDVSVACDHAKYACEKQRGSYISSYKVFDSSMVRELEDVRYIINHLDQAIQEGWIRAYYQPIIYAASGKICDEEALARWIDPERGIMSPSDFIPILEKARLIYKLDLCILDQVLEKMNTLRKLGAEIYPHSVNLSRADFDSCDIVEEIRRRVDDAGIERYMISVEVTESVIGSDFVFMKEQILRFKALGFQVWMDDFGSGYSSLDVLQEIRFDLLKFDMRFLQNFHKGEESQIILINLLRMAKELDIDALCEGVEEEDEVAFLRENGCRKLQGFYFSRPVAFEVTKKNSEEGVDV